MHEGDIVSLFEPVQITTNIEASDLKLDGDPQPVHESLVLCHVV
jgi:hypothetical protein